MHTIILASPRVDQWQAFGDTLRTNAQVDIVDTRSGAEALEAARRLNPLAVAIDAELGDLSGTELVRRLMGVNAMIYTALSSDEPEEIFHEHTEGLGILMKLSPLPTTAEAGHLAQRLRQVGGAV
jgi:CheY-like chemotaxis protein